MSHQLGEGLKKKDISFLLWLASVHRVTDLFHSGIKGMGLVSVDMVGGTWNRLQKDRQKQAKGSVTDGTGSLQHRHRAILFSHCGSFALLSSSCEGSRLKEKEWGEPKAPPPQVGWSIRSSHAPP